MEAKVAKVAEAIVVGGGVNGASALFHLAERGVRAILLERGEIAGASTGKSGGLVRMHYTDPYQARLANESLPYFADWKHRVGVGDPGFARTGFLQTVAEHNVPALYENVRMLQGIGVNTCIVNGDDVRKLQPGVYADDLIVCAFEPDSGCALPGETARSFAMAAERLGATIATGVTVTGIRVEGGRVAGVSTSDGDYDAPTVIVCAGVWGVPLFAALGVALPIEPHRTQVALFDRRGLMPTGMAGHMVFIDTAVGIYFRPYGESETLVGARGRARPTPDADNYDERADADLVADAKQRIAYRIPAMESAIVSRHWAGILDMTPDGCPILEADLGASGLYLAAGFSGSGFKSGPYVGNLMATWAVTGGRPEAAAPFALGRFARGEEIRPRHPYVDVAGVEVRSFPH
jgi:sarcosine oxidase subunit beta